MLSRTVFGRGVRGGPRLDNSKPMATLLQAVLGYNGRKAELQTLNWPSVWQQQLKKWHNNWWQVTFLLSRVPSGPVNGLETTRARLVQYLVTYLNDMSLVRL